MTKLDAENMKMAVKVLFFVVLFFAILITARDLLPSESETFKFHDMTQYARIEEFTSSIRALNIPPLYARNMNFGLGYPIFMFYAPAAYIIGSFIHILGISTIDAVKATFFVLWLTGAVGIFAYVQTKFKNSYTALAASSLYATSPWWASEIFVRGNMATSAFLAFAPWSLWSIYSYKKHYVLSIIFISATLLSHNALSVIFTPILIAYAFFASPKNRKERVMFVILSSISTAWFWFPAFLQIGQTYTKEVATMIKYSDHFLCLEQLWSAGFWGYGASLKGCADGMSFMIGKFQIVLFVAGTFAGIWRSKSKSLIYFEILLVMILVFMTLPDSAGFWNIMTPLHAIQFPWRLLAIALIFMISISAHIFDFIYAAALHFTEKKHWVSNIIDNESSRYLISMVIVTIFVLFNAKFFTGQKISKAEVMKNYLSGGSYITNSAAYEAPEYLPKTVNRDFWLVFRDKTIDLESRYKLQTQMNAFAPNIVFRIIGYIITFSSILLISLWFRHTKKTHS